MSLPKEPRQKMINIMYLVLTALLALNVSSEILNAFKTIDSSLKVANKIVQERNTDILKSLQNKLEDPKTAEKAAVLAPKAQQAQALSEALYNYIENLKHDLKVESGLKIKEGVEEYNDHDLSSTTRFLLKGQTPTRGQDLLTRLTKFKSDLAAIDPSIANEIIPKIPLNLNIPETSSIAGKNDWAYAYFNMTPPIAAVTILTKFQNDVRNSAAQVIAHCHQKVGQVEFPIDNFKAIAYSNSENLLSGDELVITAGMGAFSSAAKPSVTIDGQSVPLNTDGQAVYKTIVNNVGENVKKVHISYLDPNTGKASSVDKEVKFTVATPTGLVVSTDKTRVFYKGLDNPLSITGAGGGAQSINATVEGAGATIRKAGPGQYIVNAAQVGTVTVNVSDGKSTQKMAIPVKKVPDPIAMVGGIAGGNEMQASKFKAYLFGPGLTIELKDFVFEGIKFNPISYVVICQGKGFSETDYELIEASRFSNDATEMIKKCQSGTSVTITNIKVSEPGGGSRTLNQTMSFILQ